MLSNGGWQAWRAGVYYSIVKFDKEVSTLPKFGDLISPKDHVKIGRAVVETRAAQKLDKAEREAKERAMALQEKEMLDNLQQWWGQVD